MRIVRTLFACALAWCALIECVEAFAGAHFGMRIDGDWFLLLAASSAEELRNFIRLWGGTIFLAVCGLIALWAMIVWAAIRAKGRIAWVLLALCCLYVGYNCRSVGAAKGWAPLYVAYDTVRSVRDYYELLDAGSPPDDSTCAVCTNGTNLVVVLGESMTTDRMSLYGYAKPTTPELDALGAKLSVLGPVRPNFPDTARSLRMMLTRATEENPHRAVETAAKVFRRRGCRTVLISNQGRWERYCGVEQRLFAACETRRYLSEGGRRRFDEDVVPQVFAELESADSRPVVIFVHLLGSHFDPADCVPPAFEAPDGFDAYDRSVRYTDSLLGRLIRGLPPRTRLVYVSDHGESPDGSGWRNTRAPSMWRVPLVVYPADDSLVAPESLDHFLEFIETLQI